MIKIHFRITPVLYRLMRYGAIKNNQFEFLQVDRVDQVHLTIELIKRH